MSTARTVTAQQIIRKYLFLLPVYIFCIVLHGCSAYADQSQMQQLVPEVSRPRITKKTYLFSRSQLKYGLQKTDYLSRWIDQPLFVDPALDDGKSTSISYPSFVKMQQVALETGLDGFAFFPETSGRYLAYDFAKRSNLPGFSLLNELTPSDGPTSKDDVVKMALACPQSLRINGKLVFTSYGADSKPAEYWQKIMADFRAQYGDQFIFIPSVDRWNGQSMNDWRDKYHANTITAQDIFEIKNYLRHWARATDGLYFASAASFQNDDHTLDVDFYKNFVIRIMKSVLAESEFKQKYFGLSAVVGHENTTRVGVTLSSNATKSLRESMDAAVAANPDIINIPEWDEQNENTSLRPTVYNGTSSMRIMRYYAAKLNDEKLRPVLGDNQVIPNLIISYRKTLVVGSKLEIELLNVPDSSKSTSYTARLSLENSDGKTVYTSPVESFNGVEMQDHTITIPSETLAQYPVLIPKLEIHSADSESTFSTGLHYIDLRSTWSWDYKWIKEPLRDLMLGTKVLFQVKGKNPDGTLTANVNVQTSEPLARVQLLDNDDVIYEYSKDDPWREDANHVVLSFVWQSMETRGDKHQLKGRITLQNATAHWSAFGGYSMPKHDVSDAATISLDGQLAYSWPQRIFLSIPRAQADKAVLDIQMPGIFEGKIPVQMILDKSIYGIAGARSFNFVISRYVRQDEMQPLLKTHSAQFSVPVLPDLPNSVLHVQAIGVSGHQYRSGPIVLGTNLSEPETITTFSDTQNVPVQSQVAKVRVPDIKYEFNPQHGSVLVTDAGRPFWGMLGGFSTLATTRGGGESGDGTPFVRFERDYPKDATQSAPTWIKLDDGNFALQFDGKGTYIALPQGVIPQRSAYTISMDIKPDSATGKQLIIANRNYYTGSISIFTEDGKLKASYAGPNSANPTLDSGLTLPVGQWSHLVIRYDQANITFEVDGKISRKLSAKGPGLYNTATVVGGFGEDWFKGEIKSLEIQHFLND
jgi:hypothetical protein